MRILFLISCAKLLEKNSVEITSLRLRVVGSVLTFVLNFSLVSSMVWFCGFSFCVYDSSVLPHLHPEAVLLNEMAYFTVRELK